MSNTREPNKIDLPHPKIPSKKAVAPSLPFNGSVIKNNMFSFSFSCFDRDHKYFNLGGKEEDGTVGGKWFIKLLDCLKSVSSKTIQELKKSSHKLHPIDWRSTNVKRPDSSEQIEYWQFRINKTRGRVIGVLLDSVFYVVWLDRHHNLTDSEGYGGVKEFPKPEL